MSKSKSPLSDRYGPPAEHLAENESYERLQAMIARGSCRSFQPTPVDVELIRLLCAAALASPTKSDLQQRDIIVVNDSVKKAALLELLRGQSWTADIPHLLVFCGNNKRQRLLHKLRGHPFANDHLDAFFNAAVDAGIALSTFVTAAEAVGLGCCPISAIRNFPDEVGQLLNLPKHVFPVAGLALGYPIADSRWISPRLSLETTVHFDQYNDEAVEEEIDSYDARRNEVMPYGAQRGEDRFGASANYGWSEDKARQYALEERRDFGSYIRRQGFDLS